MTARKFPYKLLILLTVVHFEKNLSIRFRTDTMKGKNTQRVNSIYFYCTINFAVETPFLVVN